MPIFAEIYRNNILESVHHGHAVVMHAGGDVLWEMGDPKRLIFPRSSCKMLQALPLVESGAASNLTTEQLALACASHNGEDMHVSRVQNWLSEMGMGVEDLRCGPQPPNRRADRFALHDQGLAPSRAHNNCSGKHSGFLTLNQHLGGHSEYHEVDHPVQIATKASFEEMTEETSAGHCIDGCGAPNFTTSLQGLARAAASFSKGEALGGVRGHAALRLSEAMMKHPLLVAGTGRACSALMSAASGKLVAKTGAEGVFVAILPERQIGVALKIEDGATRAADLAISAILARLGVVDANDPEVKKFLNPALKNFSKDEVGHMAPSDAFWQNGATI